jgi:hypothetical protein
MFQEQELEALTSLCQRLLKAVSDRQKYTSTAADARLSEGPPKLQTESSNYHSESMTGQ